MKILVLGAGAIGFVFGGLIAKKGNSVCLVGRKPHLDAIKRQGLMIEGIWGTHRVHSLTGYESFFDLMVHEPLTFDVILLCVKSYDTEIILRELLTNYPEPCPVISLQNGLGNIETVWDLGFEICLEFGISNLFGSWHWELVIEEGRAPAKFGSHRKSPENA